MSQEWADKTAQQILSRRLIGTGVCLVLGAADTGKTSLAAALARHAVSSRTVGIVDADIGQSHLGPPTTVGWALVDRPEVDLSRLVVSGISFVGDVTPVGHLLQLTAAITQCVQRACEVAELIIIDTPGFVFGPAARALWWTVQGMLRPRLILAVQRDLAPRKESELESRRSGGLGDIVAGLKSFQTQIEQIDCPPEIPIKSPQDRRSFRQSQFNRYFQHSRVYSVSLDELAVQASPNPNPGPFVGRLAGLRDAQGADIAVGLITAWQAEMNTVAVRAPQIDMQQVRCLVIGDVSVEIAEGTT